MKVAGHSTSTQPDSRETHPGGEARFCTTQWTVVLQAGVSGPQRAAALEIFCRTYWYPLYAFVRRRGEAAEDARDLVQEFFARMLEQGWLAGVERRETRFSTLLLTIFQRHLASEHRRATAEKRGGGSAALSIDLAQAEQWFGAEPATDETPERIYERRWALAVLDAALARLREECRETGRSRHFEAALAFPLPRARARRIRRGCRGAALKCRRNRRSRASAARTIPRPRAR